MIVPFKRIKESFRKTQHGIFSRIPGLRNLRALNEEYLDDLEEALMEADLGVDLTDSLIESLRKRGTRNSELREILREELLNLLPQKETVDEKLHSPEVILVVGVNGTGKTTTIGKLANYYRDQGLKVVVGAADTFRAAADNQLKIWADRAGVAFVGNPQAKDPGAVVFDTLHSALANKSDVVIIDTAGRLHTRKNLMNELGKVKRVIQKVIPEAPHQVLLVLDATTGQNAINQAEHFIDAVDVNYLALTKLDGTAKGGIVFAIHNRFNVPVKWVGVGEKIDDLARFDPEEFVNALFSE